MRLAYRRSLHGERGLKPAESAGSSSRNSRSLHGERGLKQAYDAPMIAFEGRSLHGERGLKLYDDDLQDDGLPSLPSRGARIETVRWLSPARLR